MSIKDIRSATLGAQNKFRVETIEYNGTKVGFKQLSYAERSQLMEKCMTDGKVDSLKLQAHAVIQTAVDPDTMEKVFTEDDYETMVSQPADGYLDKFSKAAFKVLGLSDEENSAEKN